MIDDELLTSTLRDSFNLAVRGLEPDEDLLARVRRKEGRRSRIRLLARLLTPALAVAVFAGLVGLRPAAPPASPEATPLQTMDNVTTEVADPEIGAPDLSGVTIRLAGWSFATPDHFVRSSRACWPGTHPATFAAASGPGGCLQVSLVIDSQPPDLSAVRSVLVGHYKGFLLSHHASARAALLVVVPQTQGYANLTIASTSLSSAELLAITRKAVPASLSSTPQAPSATRCGADPGAS